jgi:hypothetical protein
MRVILYGDPGYDRNPPISAVLRTLDRHDIVITDGARGVSSKVEWLLQAIKKTDRPEHEIERLQVPKYDRRDAEGRRDAGMTKSGNVSAAVMFCEKQTDLVDRQTAAWEARGIPVFDNESFVEERLA